MKKFLVVTTVMILGIVGLAGFFLVQDEIGIKVINQTNQNISGMYLTYNNIKSDIKIPSLASGETYKLKVNTIENSTKDFSEGALKLYYFDNSGSLHTEYVVGYFEKGYSGDAVINIKSVDPSGNLEFEIEDNTSIY